MPLYTYICKWWEREFEGLNIPCHSCPLSQRVFKSFSMKFVGSGFHVNDYKEEKEQ